MPAAYSLCPCSFQNSIVVWLPLFSHGNKTLHVSVHGSETDVNHTFLTILSICQYSQILQLLQKYSVLKDGHPPSHLYHRANTRPLFTILRAPYQPDQRATMRFAPFASALLAALPLAKASLYMNDKGCSASQLQDMRRSFVDAERVAMRAADMAMKIPREQ
jgi:hypothetical protein